MMLSILKVLAFVVVAAITALLVWRWSDHRADTAEQRRLLDLQPRTPALFDPAMVTDLPEPAQRYFLFSIAPETPLYTVAALSMTGQISQGTKDAPNYMQMSGTQILAAPHGFIWKITAKGGPIQMSGSDTGTWTRFWLFNLAPIVRAGGNEDHYRSAFGRYTAEAVFWTPAALLPAPGVSWIGIDDNTARVTIDAGDLRQDVDVTVDAQGRPIVVQFPRWTNANPERIHRIQPFGGYLSDFQTFAGFTVPTHVEAGNHFGTEDYFPFFIADITDVQFPVR